MSDQVASDSHQPDAPAPPWVLWLVRVVLAVGVLAGVAVSGALVAQWRTTVVNTGDGGLHESTVWNLGQVSWTGPAVIATVGLVWALVSSLRRRLRAKSWMPVVCLFLLLGMAAVAASTFEPPTG